MNVQVHDASRMSLKAGVGLAALILAWAPSALYAQSGSTSSTSTSPEVQDSSGTTAAGIGDIIVTAQKREQSLNDVGMSITALKPDSLAVRGVQRPEDLIRVIPSFTVTKQEFDIPNYTLRGIGSQNSSLAASPTVSMYVDQVPLAYPIMARGATLDLARVEVLKGPQGTIFGQNSTGGLVNYIAARPTKTFSAGASASYSRFGLFEGDGFVSGPITDKVQARLAVATSQGGAWQVSATRPDDRLGNQRFSRARLSLDAQPSEALRIAFTLSGWTDHGDTTAPQAIDDFPSTNGQYVNPLLDISRNLQKLQPTNPRIADWNDTGLLRRNDYFFQPALRIDLDLSSQVTLTSITEYAQFKRNSLQDGDGVAAENQGGRLIGHIYDFNQELRLGGKALDSKLNWSVGGNFQHSIIQDDIHFQQNADAGGFQLPGLGAFIFGRTEANSRIRTLAAFANGEFALTDSLTILGGVRYTESRTAFKSCTGDEGQGDLAGVVGNLQEALGVPRTTVPGQCILLLDHPGVSSSEYLTTGYYRDTLKEHNLSWRAGINWKPFQNKTLIYANVSQGYKSGSYSLLPGFVSSQLTPATQEKLLAYEVGVKAPIGRRFQINGSAFYYDYSDQQAHANVTTILGQLQKLVNIPRSRLWGLELEAQANPFDGLSINGSATYLNSRILKNPDGTDFTVPPARQHDPDASVPVTGSSFPVTPKYSATADMQYDWKLSSQLGAFVGGALTYQGRSQASLIPADPGKPVDISPSATTSYNDPVFSLRPYTLIDLRAGIKSESGGWTLTAWGRNIFNTYYTPSISRDFDTIVRYAGQPAIYGVTFGWRM